MVTVAVLRYLHGMESSGTSKDWMKQIVSKSITLQSFCEI